MQRWPTAQLTAQAPQLLMFVSRLTHSPPQSVNPGPQPGGGPEMQAPPEQLWPSGQTTAHLPQLLRSDEVSTHSLPHWTLPAGQTPPPVSSCAAQAASNAAAHANVAGQIMQMYFTIAFIFYTCYFIINGIQRNIFEVRRARRPRLAVWTCRSRTAPGLKSLRPQL
jgi:hypothetical protein